MSENIGNQMKVHVPNLIEELMNNKEVAALKVPLLIFRDLLLQLATRASELNDEELNKLMIRLTLYDIADPTSPEYDASFVGKYLGK